MKKNLITNSLSIAKFDVLSRKQANMVKGGKKGHNSNSHKVPKVKSVGSHSSSGGGCGCDSYPPPAYCN